ncbi:unnamed protein product [Arctogadus glacialis]
MANFFCVHHLKRLILEMRAAGLLLTTSITEENTPLKQPPSHPELLRGRPASAETHAVGVSFEQNYYRPFMSSVCVGVLQQRGRRGGGCRAPVSHHGNPFQTEPRF